MHLDKNKVVAKIKLQSAMYPFLSFFFKYKKN